jgi:hypothetical protein
MRKMAWKAMPESNRWRLWMWLALIALPTLAAAPGTAHGQTIAHTNSDNAFACNFPLATANMKTALEKGEDNGFVENLAQVGHCIPLPPDIGFRTVKNYQVDTPGGPEDMTLGEVTLQDGSRYRFYVMQDDISTAPPDPYETANPQAVVPLDFGRTLVGGQGQQN